MIQMRRLFHTRKQYYGLLKKTLLFITKKELFTSQDVNWWTVVVWIICGLLWCFYQLFGLSFWRHPFTAEDLLLSKWCNAEFHQICSDEETNSSTSWMDWGWEYFQQFFIFGWTTPLIKCYLPFLCNYLWKLQAISEWKLFQSKTYTNFFQCRNTTARQGKHIKHKHINMQRYMAYIITVHSAVEENTFCLVVSLMWLQYLKLLRLVLMFHYFSQVPVQCLHMGTSQCHHNLQYKHT